MHSIDWFHKPHPRDRHGGLLAAALKAAIGLGAGAFFYFRGHIVLGAIAAGIAVVFFLVSLSPAGRAALAKAFSVLGELLGRAIGTLLLSAIFLLVLTPVRALRRLAGADDLRLRDRHERSYWLACDSEDRKRRFASAMFATELKNDGGGRRGVLLLAAIVVLLLASEGGLRIRGYGHPPVYISDPITGYHLAPQQKTEWQGVSFETNRFGMRAPERPDDKAPGTLRILTLASDGGLHVEQDALFGRGLEARLRDKSGARVIEVWNADVTGWGPPSMRGYVERFGSFGADVAVIVLGKNALEQPKQSLLFTPFFPADRPPRFALEEVILDGLFRYRADRTPVELPYARTLRAIGAAEVGMLARTLVSRGAEPVLVTFAQGDGASEEDRAPFRRAIEEVESANGRALVLPESFAGSALDPASSTLTRTGHAVLAERIASDLLEKSTKLRAFLGGTAP